MPNDSSSSTVRKDRFSRTIDFLGEEGFERLRGASVTVVGLGGVGSHAALALTRAGVGKITLVDFDKVSSTDLNRHSTATAADVGELKCNVVKQHLLEVFPEAKIETKKSFFNMEAAPKLLSGPPDFVVDAIDGLNTKVALLRYCVENSIKVVSSMGASARSDPSLVRVGPIEESHGCPLAKVVRKRLRRQGIEAGIIAVYSTEPPKETFPPDENEKPYNDGRKRRRLPSLSTLPGIFGYACASVVINEIAGVKSE